MPRLSSTGKALMGINGGEVSVDGSVPAELSAYTGGNWDWLSVSGSGTIAGQASNGGPWQLYEDVLATATVSVLSATPANQFYAGNGKWTSIIQSTPTVIHSNVSGLDGLTGKGLGRVSRTGQTVLVDSFDAGGGLTVYSTTGATLLALPNVKTIAPYIFLADDILSYETSIGWNLARLTDGGSPRWAPRTSSAKVIPVMLGSTLYVLEQGDTLTIRQADQPKGFVLWTPPTSFNPDVVVKDSSTLRVAFSTNAGESPDALTEIDVNPVTGAWSLGTVVAGAVVFVTQTPALTLTTFPDVGPLVGDNLTDKLFPPFRDPVIDPTAGPNANKMTPVWQGWAKQVGDTTQSLDSAIQQIPKPIPPVPSFGTVAPNGQPSVVATSPNDVLTLLSEDGTIGYVTVPTDRSVDIRVIPQGPDGAVQYNDNGTLAGDANNLWHKTIRQLALTGDGATSTIVTDSGTPNVIAVGRDGEPSVNLGSQVIAGVETAEAVTQAYFYRNTTEKSAIYGASTNETPGSPTAYTDWIELHQHPLLAENEVRIKGGDATGAIPGKSIGVDRNAAGSGAASTLGLQRLDGTDEFVWFDATGAPRYGPARPTEDGSVSDTSGTKFGTGDVTHTGTLVANELIVGNGGADIKAVAATDGQIPIGKTSDGSVTLATLTAGANVTITNGPGTVTIASTGGGGSGVDGWVEGVFRALGDGSTTTFDLPDVAESLLFASDSGAIVDPLLYTLGSTRDQIVFGTAPTAGHVLQINYELASA